jgi:hypothetical protein
MGNSIFRRHDGAHQVEREQAFVVAFLVVLLIGNGEMSEAHDYVEFCRTDKFHFEDWSLE